LSRQRLDFGPIGKVELAHEEYTGTGKAAAESAGKVQGELVHESFSVAGPFSSTLLLLKNPLTDPLIRCCHKCVDSSAGLLPRVPQPFGNSKQQGQVFRR
jgi:hypothetical protein